MNGYSVEQAAEVLGIPQGRVWELIARGVLAGASEGGESMRVYLRGTAPAAVTASAEGGDRPNGNGHNGNGHTELSPFRELLTEFRNLTERYGQALLALGEARGEVASLRGRVELLEARMDMRLPMRSRPSAAWEMPDLPQRRTGQPETVAPPSSEADRTQERSEGPDSAVAQQTAEPVEETAEAPADVGEADAVADIEAAFEAAFEAEPEAEPEMVDADVETAGATAAPFLPDVVTDAPTDEELPVPAVDAVLPASEGRRGRGDSRAAIAGLAAALARAEDPVLASLPGAREAAEALAALQHEMDTGTTEELERPSPVEGLTEDETVADREGEAEPEAAEVHGLSGIEELSAVAPAIELEEEALGDEQLAEEPIAIYLDEDLVGQQLAEEPMDTDVAPEAVQVPAAAELPTEPVDVVVASDAVPEPMTLSAESESASLPADDGWESPYTTDVVEPDWFADGDFTWLETPEPEPEATPESAAVEQEGPVAEAEPIQDEAALRAGGEPHPEAAALSVEPEPMVVEEPATEADWTMARPEPEAVSATASSEADADLLPASPEGRMEPAEQEPVTLAEEAAVASDWPAAGLAEGAGEDADAVSEPVTEPGWVAMDSEPMVEPTDTEPTSSPGSDDEPDEGWPAHGHGGDEEGLAAEPAEPELAAPDRSAASSEVEISERIQDAFAEPEPEDAPDGSGTRTEAIHIEVAPGPTPDDDASWVTGERARAAAASGVAGFGLFKGQPEAPPAAERAPRPLPDRDEDALMWFGDEFEAEALEIAAPGWRGEEAPAAEPASPPPPVRPPLQLSDAEIEQLADEEGWDVEEVQAIRGLLGRPFHARELEQTQMHEATPPLSSYPGDDEGARPDAPEPTQAAEPDRPGAQRSARPRPAPASRSQPLPPDWLRGRRGPAANAYRRLRRIFPG